MRRFSLLPALLLSVALTFSLTACDSNDDDNDNGGGTNVGNSSVTVTGDITDSFSGNAYFVVDEEDEDVNFAIALISGAITNPNSGQVVALGRDGGRPGTGTYTIDTEGTNTDFHGGYTNYEDESDFSGVVADSGTLQITSSSASRIVGTFTFTGRAIDSDAPMDTTRTATVEGDFEAEFIDTDNVPDPQF